MPRLPLTNLEEYLRHEDRPGYPCWMLARFRFRGRLDRAALERAWPQAVDRQPLLRSVVRESGWGRRPHWEQIAPPPPPRWLESAPAGGWPAWEPLDLTRGPLVQSCVVESGEMTDLLAAVHHAGVDGGSVLGAFHDLLLAYARECGQPVELPPVRTDHLPRRDRLGGPLLERLRSLPLRIAGLAFALTLLRRRIASLLPQMPAPAPEGPAPQPFPAIARLRLPPAQWRELRQAAKGHGCSVHDLIMRDVFGAIGAWRTRHGLGDRLDWIRLGVPLSLRRPSDRHLPACNVFGLIGIDRQARSLGDRPRMLRRAVEDMNLIRAHRLGSVYLSLLRWLRRMPGGLRAYSHRPVVRSTLVMTNIGQVAPPRSPLMDRSQRLAVPGAVLEDVTVVGPYRPGTPATLTIAVYAGQLLADLHYDPRVLTAELAEDFVACLEEQLAESR